MDRAAVLMPFLTASPGADGSIVLTRKFHDGVLEKLQHWDGPFRVLLEPAPNPTNNLDSIAVEPGKLPYQLDLLDFRSPEVAEKIRDAAVVLAMVGWHTTHLSRLCRRLKVPLVYFTEYTLKTRLQIAHAEEHRPLFRARRYVFELNQERRNQLAIPNAVGIQCNGTPTFDAYRFINARPLLYFDSRLRASEMIGEEQLEKKLASLDQKRPLHLVFSGRLDPMKGADHLPGIARELMSLGVDFRLTICGGGRLVDRISADIQKLGLEKHVSLKGILHFDRELIPFIKKEADLFLGPHVQGDPACTYIETFGCGVPMVGFDNEALTGMLRHGDVGWVVPLGDERRAAEVIQRLDRDREAIKRASRAALQLARKHPFEQMIRQRVEHLRECARDAGATFSLRRFMSGQLARLTTSRS